MKNLATEKNKEMKRKRKKQRELLRVIIEMIRDKLVK